MTERKPLKIKKILVFILLTIFLISIITICKSIDPEGIITRIGTRNGYMVAFAVSFFAGFSSFTMVSFYSVILTFISGGLNPVLLALVAGSSLSAGDIFLYYFGRKGRDMISGKVDRAINRMTFFFKERKLEKFIPLISYCYFSFIPLPNDWILLFLASIRYPQKNMNLIISLGDFTHAALVVFLCTKGIVVFN